jgi:hypothetical protein
MKVLSKILALSVTTAVAASPALAHVGNHFDHSPRALISHLLEWDHLAMIAGAAVLVAVAFRKVQNRINKTKAQ